MVEQRKPREKRAKDQDVVNHEDSPEMDDSAAFSPVLDRTLDISQDGATLISNFIKVGLYKVKPHATAPEYATPGSMCFDLKACFDEGDVVTGYTSNNVKANFNVVRMRTADGGVASGISIPAHQRALVPTGLIFDLPAGFALLLYPRSGMSLKQGAKLGNCVGVVDSDYVEQTYAIIQNDADIPLTIMSGDKICQGEVVEVPPQANFIISSEPPAQKTTRAGGFGSTGK